MQFDEFFRVATESNPYPFQQRFATDPELPHLLRAPTGAGKTATAVLGWMYRWTNREEYPDTPRRLVYCLPMRVLVEQSEREAKNWISKLKLDVPVHVLMGGVDTEKWYLHPERPAVLIGTQDMLLSRALNRGYAASRFHWPIDFGLLNTDCLWVFDEPQLMGSGVSTSAQLAGLRGKLDTFGQCPSVWMSATLEKDWLRTIDLRDSVESFRELRLSDAELSGGVLGGRMTARKVLHATEITATDKTAAAAVAKLVVEKHGSGPLTLVVVNTVNRAKEVFAAVAKLVKKGDPRPDLVLIHSRFRPVERAAKNAKLQDKSVPAGGRIIVATQVVEAGVDLSARVLITELAPWSSLVQRFGRCHRYGEPEWDGEVHWVNVSSDEKAAAPYSPDELTTARGYLTGDGDRPPLNGRDVSPQQLEEFQARYQIRLPFEHTHVLRRRDLLDLFDTAPDLSGNDIDVSRFVRGDKDEIDVQVFWRVGPPNNGWDATERRRQAARREELCNVPIGSFKKEFLEAGKTAYRWDFLDEQWRELGKRDTGTIVPGQVFWVPTDQGGYDPHQGWSPTAGPLPDSFPLPLPAKPGLADPDEFDGDDWSRIGWRTIAGHTDEVAAELAEVVRVIKLTGGPATALALAARWHDWGKAHPVFQAAIRQQGQNPQAVRRWKEAGGPEPPLMSRPEGWEAVPDLAKAPDGFWQRYKRRRFRHELASALGVLSASGDLPNWADAAADVRNLAAYLMMSHHGKVRLSIRAMPDEPPDPNHLFACGVHQGDRLPAVSLGGATMTPEVELNLFPMRLGGAASWSALALKLLADLGPFRLAYLEALLRAADCRASAKADTETEVADA